MLSESSFHILTTILTLLLPPLLALYIRKDYKAFLSLGPGGTPSTPLGYVKIKFLSIICLRDPLRPPYMPPHFRPQKGYLSPTAFTARRGPRPSIQGIAPQRQQTQKASSEIYKSLVSRLQHLTKDAQNQLFEGTSCFEKHSSGIFTSIPIVRTCGGEVCHAHPSDGSMHLTLHPIDAKMVLESGRGERHPLARGGWCRRFVPKEFMLICAPRDEEEIEVVMKIVHASIWWVSGIDVEGAGDGRSARGKLGEGVQSAMEGSECWTCKANACGANQVEKLTSSA